MNISLSWKWPALGATILLLVAAGCSGEAVREFFGYSTPRERYEQALRDAGLHRTALGEDWLAAAAEALDGPVPVQPPYREEGYLDPKQATATAYRVSLQRGQLLEVAFETEPDTGYRVFIDLFQAPRRPDAEPRHVTSADSLDREFDYFIHRDGDYLVRIQPELLRGGRYSIRLVVRPSLHFPLYGRDASAIGSWYGDGRDGGHRRHEGLDIFAPRGTPVIAAAAGVVRSTRSNRLGGNVVWLRDEFGQTHYYAHLDTQLVRRGQRVTIGDTLGLVGNSGNARLTPPHLHFGLYSRGSYDPFPALEPLPTAPEDFSADPNLIGQTVRVTRAAARLRLHPTTRSEILAELPRHTPLQVAAGSGVWYRVIAPDGTLGFVAANLTEPADHPLRSELLGAEAMILIDPAPAALAVESVAAGVELAVLGSFREFLLVQGPSGRLGWLALD